MAAPDPNRSVPDGKNPSGGKPAAKKPTAGEKPVANLGATGADLAETTISNDADSNEATPVAAKKSPAKPSGAPLGKSADRPASGTARGSTDTSSGGNEAAGEQPAAKVTQLGDFRLVRKLGQGGMGVVYLAVQVSLDRKVALKTLSKDLAKKEDLVKRFIREARSMARLQHPNIVQVYAADSQSGVHFAAIEFIDGKSMQKWTNELGKLSVGDALHICLVCADAIRHAHDQNMIHRDIKPDNILVTTKGVVKVADFGLAKALDEDVSMTQSGTGLGTPLYMAPEQARNAKHVDQRSDIYALGCTLYHFLTGQLPFSGSTTLELILSKEKGQFTPARRFNSEVPERLDLMIDKMMAKDPQYRYANCADIIRDLQSLNLANPGLSFIDSPVVSSVAQPALGTRSQIGQPSRSAAGKTTTSAQSATRPALDETAAGKTWFVQHTDPSGKVVIAKMSTAQIQAGIKSGGLNLKTKAKSSAQGSALPLGQYAEFAQLVQQQAVREKAENRAAETRNMFQKLDKLDRRYRRWRWLRNLLSDMKSLINFLIYLGIVGFAIFAAYHWGLPYVKEKLARPDTAAPQSALPTNSTAGTRS